MEKYLVDSMKISFENDPEGCPIAHCFLALILTASPLSSAGPHILNLSDHVIHRHIVFHYIKKTEIFGKTCRVHPDQGSCFHVESVLKAC